MNKIIIIFGLAFILVHLIPNIQADELPTKQQVKDFLEELINDYNIIIYYREQIKLDKDEFDFKTRFFSLYLYSEKGNSFEIINIRAEENSNVVLLFLVEPSKLINELKITYDYEHTLSYYLPGYSITGTDNVLRGAISSIDNVYRYEDFVFSATSSRIINDDSYADWYAEKIYQGDLQQYEKYKINEIWEPFKENYTDIISNYDNLKDTKDNIQYKINVDNNYNYESFLIDFIPFNQTVQHYFYLQIMINEWNDFKNYTSSIDFCINCYPDINSSYHNIEHNIYNNESYIYSDYQYDKLILDEQIQNKITEAENKRIKEDKYRQNWYYAILFFFINTGILLAYLIVIILQEKKEDRILSQLFVFSITGIISVIWGVYTTKITEDLLQTFFPLFSYLVISIVYILYRYNKSHKTQGSKNKNNNANKKGNNNEK